MPRYQMEIVLSVLFIENILHKNMTQEYEVLITYDSPNGKAIQSAGGLPLAALVPTGNIWTSQNIIDSYRRGYERINDKSALEELIAIVTKIVLEREQEWK
jgi:hypothetical protein